MGIRNKDAIKKIEEQGYIKIDKKTAAKLDASMKAFPVAIMNADSYDTYRVIYDKSKGTLQKANGGGFRANIVGEEGNNDIVGQAKLEKPGEAAKKVADAFAVMSIAVGEYYMSEIDQKLGDIDTKLDSIVDFLEAEQKAKIVGWEEFLKKAQKNMFHYESDDVLRTSALTTILSIQKDTLTLIENYRLILEEKCDNLDISDKADDAKKKILDIVRVMYLYWNATFLYTYADALEATVSKNPTESFLDNKVEEMLEVSVKYKDEVLKACTGVSEYINNLKALSPNKFLSLIELLQYVNPEDHRLLSKFGFLSKATAGIEEKDIVKKKNKREKLIDLFNFEPITNIDLMIAKINDVIRYNAICNKPVEVIKSGNDFYIRTEAKLM